MRSKVIVWAYLIILSFGTMVNLYMPKTEAAAKESIVIPGEAIRLRILANSDFEKDQAIKRKVRDAVNAQITLWVQDLTSLEKAKTVINSKLPEIQTIAEKVVKDQGSNQSVKVEFGKVQFPTKLYGQFLYPAGKYQAVLITLGKGEGANWWCVLYPPLCFLDFSNGVAVSPGFDEAEEDETAKEQPVEQKTQQPKVHKESNKENVKQQRTVPNVEEEPNNKEGQEQPRHQKDEQESSKETEGSDETATEVTAQPARPEVSKEDYPNVKSANVKSVDQADFSNEEPKKSKEAPVYTEEDEEPVKVKFFVLEMWEKLFH